MLTLKVLSSILRVPAPAAAASHHDLPDWTATLTRPSHFTPSPSFGLRRPFPLSEVQLGI
jgi:hypothetical protein